MQALHVPMAHELGREPVEQVWMRWPLALPPEILRRLDQPCAEVKLPDAVDVHATGERIGRIDEPFRETQPIVRQSRPHPREFGWHIRLHSLARLVVLPSNENMRRPRRGNF